MKRMRRVGVMVRMAGPGVPRATTRWLGMFRVAAVIALGATTLLALPGQATTGTSFDAAGWVRHAAASSARTLTVADTGGTAGWRGRDVALLVDPRARVSLDGRPVALSAIHDGDEIRASGITDTRGRHRANVVEARTPPQPDGPAPLLAPTCAYYTCTPGLPPTTSGGTLLVTIKNFVFNPPASVIALDTTVQVRNTDGFAHTFSGNNLNSGPLVGATDFSVTFTQPGTYRFFCAIHPFMNGVLYVR